MVAQTSCDAVMIGRMAPANPWIFRQIEQYVSRSTARAGADALVRLAERSSAASGQFVCPLDEGVRGYVTSDWETGKAYEEPTEADRYQMIRTYFQMLLEEEMPGAEGKMKQFASWFTHGIPGGAALRKAIYEARSGGEILGRVEEFFEAKLTAPTT
jgi:tRNA-dihydrouridine synthase